MSIGRTWDFLTPARHSSNIVLNMGIKVDWMTAFALASDPALNNVSCSLCYCSPAAILGLIGPNCRTASGRSPSVEAPFDNSAFPIYIEETKP